MASVRVPVAHMVTQVQLARAEEEASIRDKQAERVAAYPPALKEWKATARAQVGVLQKAITAGEGNFYRLTNIGDPPHKPLSGKEFEEYVARNLRPYERDLAILAATSQETLSVSTGSDWARYL